MWIKKNTRHLKQSLRKKKKKLYQKHQNKNLFFIHEMED